MLSAFNFLSGLLTIISGLFTIASFVYALYQISEKKKLKLFAISVLQGSAGNICKVQQSTEWALNNFREVQKLTVELEDSEIKKEIIKKVSDGQADAAAADRLAINLFGDFMTMQEAQFNTREIKHPEKNELNLWKKELRSR